MKTVTELLPLQLLILCYPLGVAGQNITIGVSFLLLIERIVRYWSKSRWRLLLNRFGASLAVAALVIIWPVIATYLNPNNFDPRPMKSLWGYLIWWIIPPAVFLAYGSLTIKQWQKLKLTLTFMCVVWGTIAVSQYVIGWRFVGASVVTDGARPRGLYSHPLTFAYAAVMLWPLCIALLLRRVRDLSSWLLTLGIGTVILLTQSRTIQVLAVVAVVVAAMASLKGKTRLGILAVMTGALLYVATTQNIISDKFHKTFTGEGVDRFSSYPDDRLAFWHAHWLMIQEKPIVGHGTELDTAYREPYYERLGLDEFKKKYEAHNLFIQLTANGGLVGLGLFLTWLILQWRIVYRYTREGFAKHVASGTLLLFVLAALTQNSFQDSEVRTGLTYLVTCIWLAASKKLQT